MIRIVFILGCLFLFSCSADQTKEENKEKEIRQEDQTVETQPTADSVIPISFPSTDNILIQANIYEVDKTAPVILLCHQARWNKTEYKDIAPQLKKMGFNCIAIDQRSGGLLNDSLNITSERAKKAGLPVDYLDAEKDILAAIDFAYNRYGKPIIIWGSSYSSTLALYAALESDKVKAVVSFSPGDYFVPEKRPLKELLTNFSKPYFVTSSKEEEPELTALFSNLKKDDLHVQFVPAGTGKHGSSALWDSEPDHEEYRIAVTKFLNALK